MSLNRNHFLRFWASFGLFFMLNASAVAFALLGSSWPNDTARYYLNSSSSKYDAAFILAMDKWNGRSNFTFTRSTTGAFQPSCSGSPNRKNSYQFTSTICGNSYGNSTLAVTTTYFDGSGNITDADIVFNNSKNWDVFNGSNGSKIDFRRVAVHELGHALGLDHSASNAAIMQPFITETIVDPQSDDIDGLRAIYGGTGGGGGGSDDFFVQNSRLSFSSVTPGSTTTARTEQHYVGSSSSTLTPRVGYYLSSNTSLGNSDQLLGSDASDLSISDTQDNESATIRIPSNTASGQYYILFVADHDNVYAESNENNNIQAVSLTVASLQRSLSVSVNGNGSVTSSPVGINCPADCFQSYNLGELVSLSAQAAGGWKFKQWSGACAGSGACVVSMSSNRSVSAVFEKNPVIPPILYLLLLDD